MFHLLPVFFSEAPFYFLENIAPTILTNTLVDSVWVKLSSGNINGTDENIFCDGNICVEKDGGLLFHNSDFISNEAFMELLKNNLSYVNHSLSPIEGMREIVFVPYHKNYVGDTATLYMPVHLAPHAGGDGILSICEENTVVNLFDYLIDVPEPNGNWVPATNMGNGDFNPIMDEGGEYVYIVEGGECPDDSASVYVEINELPVFSFIAEEVVCGEVNTLIKIDRESEDYLWSDGSNEKELTVFDSGEYWLELTDGNGCSWRDSIYIYFGENIEETILMEICEGDYVDFLEGEIYMDTVFCETYNSADGCDSTFCFSVNVFPIYEKTDTAYLGNGKYVFNGMEYDSPGIYFSNLISENGCDSIFNLILLENKIEGEGIYIPNAFSPNEDGVNDFFEIYTAGDFQLLEIKIFDRWGSMVFYSENETNWDGKFEGELLPVGIYAYVLKIKNPAGAMEYKNGAVNLFR